MSETDRGDFLPTATADTLRSRSAVLQQIRQFFLDRDFVEVDTPILSRDTVVDCYIDPVEVFLGPSDSQSRMWLQTSPEFAMKRLLAAGLRSIFQVTRAVRNGERGPQHNPEFTIVEWYQVGQSYGDGRRMLGDLCCALLGTSSPEERSYAEVFREFVGVDPFVDGPPEFRQQADHHAIDIPASLDRTDRDEWLNLLLATCVEPKLGRGRPTILYDFPATQAALANVNPDNPLCAERFELYVEGVELANGYHELLDAEELRKRNQRNNRKRVRDNRPAVPSSSFLLTAMEHGLPACTGVALGFDRLMMLATKATTIDQVIPFPIERA